MYSANPSTWRGVSLKQYLNIEIIWRIKLSDAVTSADWYWYGSLEAVI